MNTAFDIHNIAYWQVWKIHLVGGRYIKVLEDYSIKTNDSHSIISRYFKAGKDDIIEMQHGDGRLFFVPKSNILYIEDCGIIKNENYRAGDMSAL